MIIQQSPFANSVTPFSTLGKQPVGEESVEAKAAALPPVEELAETAGSLNRKDPSDTTAESDERRRVAASGETTEETAAAAENVDSEERLQGREQKSTNDQAIQFTDEELRQIETLAARDREVRAHEQAHVAVGGQFTGAASFSYQEGPNGVRYAVGGEVSISSGAVSGDPQATISKAQQVQRAALAPAEPSTQDRSVAANAARLALDARSQLSNLQAEERVTEREGSQQRLDESKEAEAAREDQRQASESEKDSSDASQERRQQNVDINQRLLDIGISEKGQDIGAIVDSVV